MDLFDGGFDGVDEDEEEEENGESGQEKDGEEEVTTGEKIRKGAAAQYIGNQLQIKVYK